MLGMYSIHHEVKIAVPVEKVYKATSLLEQLNNWWTLQCSGKPIAGAVYNLFFSEEYNWFAEVSVAVNPTQFELKMTHADEDWEPTSFGFRLQAIGDHATLLEFYHVNWPECNHHFRRASFSWAMLLKGLKNYLEKEIIVPFTDRE